MINHYLTNKTHFFNGFNRFSSFVLIGNNIDGFVNIDVMEFATYQEAMSIIPGIFSNLKFEGEWNLSFYQVPNDFKIRHQYGYYKVPKKGRRVFDFGYMKAGKRNEIFLTPGMIHIATRSKDFERNRREKEVQVDYLVYEEFYTTILREDLNRKSFDKDDYPGEIIGENEYGWKLN